MANLNNKMPGAVAGLRTLQESYDALATRNVEQEEGRKAIAHAITEKGVPTSEDSSMQQMAENVGLIQQETYELEGAPMYEKQMFGAETISPIPYKQNGPLWNLYKVMTDILSDARFINYGGILLAEYYKGYETIELMNAGAGGAYFTCDGDFYTTDQAGENAHVWHDGDNGMVNRWVAYLFASPSTNYTIPSVELCPRSIHIGRSVGTIINNYTSRITDIVITDGSVLDDMQFTNGDLWGTNIILHGIETHTRGDLFYYPKNTTYMLCDIKKLDGGNIINEAAPNLIIADFPYLSEINVGTVFNKLYGVGAFVNLRYVNMPSLTTFNSGRLFWTAQAYVGIYKIYMPNLSVINGTIWERADYPPTDLIDVEVGALETNFKFNAWNPTNVIADPTKLAQLNANIRDHIAAKVSDRTGQTALIFTISTNLYNNLEQATKDAFTAKNWEVRGA